MPAGRLKRFPLSGSYSSAAVEPRLFSIQRIGYGPEIVAEPVGQDAAEYEETAVGDDDVTFPKKAVVHRHIRRDTIGLGRAWELSNDAAVLLRRSSNA